MQLLGGRAGLLPVARAGKLNAGEHEDMRRVVRPGVEIFRSAKSLLETRPIFHKCDDTIRGHVFCSFLALVLRKALQERLADSIDPLEWAHVIADLEALEEVEVNHQGKRFLLRSETKGTCGKVFQAVRVALPPTVRQIREVTPTPNTDPRSRHP